MLVSKIKPCMSKFTPLHGETANGSLNQLLFLRSYTYYMDNYSNSGANTCQLCLGFIAEAGLLDQNQSAFTGCCLMTLDNQPNRMTLRRRCIFQVSDLSSVDGELYAHHGDNG